ncbi:unnamed protein product [Phytophthora fragariaefolia]|uniref:Unnamed protein product n=1 Tax=Phytophthora fragariaefolia TaxID=1490495 RepID=A0A9W7D744_9STRA|nr:unnamed protein product [Phytophthora fragariaefolia]
MLVELRPVALAFQAEKVPDGSVCYWSRQKGDGGRWGTGRVLFKQVLAWMVYGEVVDPYREFFIKKLEDAGVVRQDKGEAAVLWHQQFALDLEAVPLEYFPTSVAESVLEIGKAVHILTRANQFSPREAQTVVAAIAALARRPVFDVVAVEHEVEKVRRHVASRLHEEVVVKSDFVGYLHVLKGFFLLSRGEVFQTFIERSFDMMLLKPTSKSEEDINHGVWREIVRELISENEPWGRDFDMQLPLQTFALNGFPSIDGLLLCNVARGPDAKFLAIDPSSTQTRGREMPRAEESGSLWWQHAQMDGHSFSSEFSLQWEQNAFWRGSHRASLLLRNHGILGPATLVNGSFELDDPNTSYVSVDLAIEHLPGNMHGMRVMAQVKPSFVGESGVQSSPVVEIPMIDWNNPSLRVRIQYARQEVMMTTSKQVMYKKMIAVVVNDVLLLETQFDLQQALRLNAATGEYWVGLGFSSLVRLTNWSLDKYSAKTSWREGSGTNLKENNTVVTARELWHALSLRCNVRWPLQLLVTPDLLRSYGHLFQFCFRLKRVAHALELAWKSRTLRSKDATGKRSATFAAAGALRIRMSFVVRTLELHFQVFVIEGKFQKCVEQIEAAGDFDRAKRVHETFVASIVKSCYVHTKTVASALDELLSCCWQFAEYVLQQDDAAGGDSALSADRVALLDQEFHRRFEFLYSVLQISEARDLLFLLDSNGFFAAERERRKRQHHGSRGDRSTFARCNRLSSGVAVTPVDTVTSSSIPTPSSLQLQDPPADECAVLDASYALMEDATRPPAASRSSKSELLAVHGDYAQDAGDSKRECRWWACCWWRRARHAADKSLGIEASEERSASRMSLSARAKTHDQMVAARQLKQQIAHYSTMRVHMKRVQLCLEQEKRNKFYKELVVYLCFLGVIMATLLTLPVHFPYEQNSALDNTYFEEQLPDTTYAKNFYDIGNEGEMWQWASGPMLYQFYEPPIRNCRPIGSIQMRTGRVKGALCSQTSSRNDFVMFTDEVCYPEYSASRVMTEPYGNDSGVLGAQYNWTSELSKLLRSETFKPGLVSHEMDYGHGGYVVYLPRDNYTAATALIAQMQSDFIRDGTRYMVSTFAFYNARSNIFSHVQGLFEMSNTDYMEVTGRIKSFRILASYRETGDFLEANALVIVLLIATLLLVYREISDVRNYGVRKYVQSLWNMLDMLQLVLLVVFITYWILFIVRSENLRDDLYRVGDMDCSGPAHDQEMARECYVDIEPLAWLSRSVTNYAAALGLVSVAIVFKYLRLNSRLNLLWRTLRFAAKDLLAFVIIFFTIFFGFAVMGFLTFGTAVQQYHSLSVSLTSCFQMLLGAFDYEEIYVANPTMAGIFFFSFMISIYLICVNMFIAIMSEYYSLAQNEKKTLEENKRNLAVTTKEDDDVDEDFRDALQFMDVEYDLAKQTKNYMNGLRVRVKMPPIKNATSMYNTEQLVLCGFQRVLLVDYDYLMAERKRLRRKFRACVHVIMVCGDLMRQNDPDFTMRVEMEFVNEHARPRANSTDSFADLVEFPVTYVPISSSLANTVEILKRLKPGMSIEIDDGSLTKDQITLEVLGGQDEYIPSQFKRRDQAIGYSDDYDGCSNNEGFRVRISENTVTDMHGSSPNGKIPFGLRHDHPNIGGANHIRACRVLYNGNALLDGNEMCIMPRSTWIRYFTGYVGWGYLKRLLSFKRKKKKTHRLVTDADVDRLIKESFAAPGRGISCRFDELVRNFRMFIAKKVHKRHLRIPNLEDRIFQEVITFLERFPSAITPLDKRELEGYKYTPQPIDTRRIRLPHSINLLAELLSQNAHEVWAVGRIDQGWRWGTQRDNDKLLHPDLVPYEALTEQDKQYDRDTSMAALKVITALGYVLEPPSSNEEQFDVFDFGTAATEPGGTYEPKPIPTDDVKVPPHLRSVIELLAENTHEVWAQMRMEQGWKFGPRRNDAKKEHNGLVPYIYLTQDEKQMDRNTAMQTVKLILRFGFNFVHKDQRTRGGKKKHSGHIKVVGRNENAEAHNVSEAVSLARGATRAKRAFLGRSGRPFSSIRSGSANSLFSMNSSSSSDTATSQESQQRRVDEAHARLIATASSSAMTVESSGDIAMPLSSFQSMNSAESFDSPKAGGDSSTNTQL